MMDAETRRIARERIRILFKLASRIIHKDPPLAHRYVQIARRIAMAARIKLQREYRRQVCRNCKRFILPGVNCRIRIKQRREPHVAITCLECGAHMRIPLRGHRSPKRDKGSEGRLVGAI